MKLIHPRIFWRPISEYIHDNVSDDVGWTVFNLESSIENQMQFRWWTWEEYLV